MEPILAASSHLLYSCSAPCIDSLLPKDISSSDINCLDSSLVLLAPRDSPSGEPLCRNSESPWQSANNENHHEPSTSNFTRRSQWRRPLSASHREQIYFFWFPPTTSTTLSHNYCCLLQPLGFGVCLPVVASPSEQQLNSSSGSSFQSQFVQKYLSFHLIRRRTSI